MRTYTALAVLTLAPIALLFAARGLEAQYPPGYPSRGYPQPSYPQPDYPPSSFPSPGYGPSVLPGRPAYGPPAIRARNGTVTILRMLNPATGDHVWTTDPNEVDTLLYTRTWILEGPAFQLNGGPAEGLVPLYRVYWPETGDHSLATVPPKALPPGAQPEGILGYAQSEALPGLVPLFGFRNKYGREFFTVDPNGENVSRRSQRFAIGFVQPPQ